MFWVWSVLVSSVMINRYEIGSLKRTHVPNVHSLHTTARCFHLRPEHTIFHVYNPSFRDLSSFESFRCISNTSRIPIHDRQSTLFDIRQVSSRFVDGRPGKWHLENYYTWSMFRVWSCWTSSVGNTRYETSYINPNHILILASLLQSPSDGNLTST